MRFKVRSFVLVMLFFVGAMGRGESAGSAHLQANDPSEGSTTNQKFERVGLHYGRVVDDPSGEKRQCEEDHEVERYLADLKSAVDRHGSNLTEKERASVGDFISGVRELGCSTNPEDNKRVHEQLETVKKLVDDFKALPTDPPGGTSKAPVVASSVPSTPGSGGSSFVFKVSGPQGDVSVGGDSGGISYPLVTTGAAAHKPTAPSQQIITPTPRPDVDPLATHTPSPFWPVKGHITDYEASNINAPAAREIADWLSKRPLIATSDSPAGTSPASSPSAAAEPQTPAPLQTPPQQTTPPPSSDVATTPPTSPPSVAAEPPKPAQTPAQVQSPQQTTPPSSPDVAVKPPARSFLFPERDLIRDGKPWLTPPGPQMPETPGQPENAEEKLSSFPKLTPAQPMVFNSPSPLVISQRPDPVLPEALTTGASPHNTAQLQNTAPNTPQNIFSEKPNIVPPVFYPKESLSNQSAPSANLSPSASPKPSPNLVAAPPAQAAPVAKETVPMVVVISQAVPKQIGFLDTPKEVKSEKSFLEKNNLKSEGGISPSAGVVLTQKTQKAASKPDIENTSSSEAKTLSANKKGLRILPGLAGALGKLREVLLAKKRGTASAANYHELNQDEKARPVKDPWAVDRSPSSWQSNAGLLQAGNKDRNSISFASLKVWAGAAAAISALIALVAYLFYKKQLQSRKPTWVEVIIDYPGLRKRPERKVKSLSRP